MPIALLAPGICLLGILAYGLALIFRFSVFRHEPGSLVLGGLTAQNYLRILDSLYLGAVWETLLICFWVTLGSVVIGYPIAYALIRHPRRWVRSTILALTVLPLILGIVVRSYAWTLVLGQRGFLNGALRALGAGARA